MITQIMKLKNQTLILPKDWQGKEIFIQKDKDTIVIKKMERLKFEKKERKNRVFAKDIEKKLQVLGKKITQKDIEKAIIWARQKSNF